MPSNRRRLKFVGIILCLVGFCLIIGNFLYPHIVLIEIYVEVPHQVTVPNEQMLGSFTNSVLELRNQLSFVPKPISAGQIFKVTWSSDTSLVAYMFTQNQFENYSVNGLYQIRHQAKGEGRNGSLTYNVQNSDNYTAVLRNNPLMDGSSAQVYEFRISSIAYINQTQYTTQKQIVPQNDNLYLYFGLAFVFPGILMIFYPLFAGGLRNVWLLQVVRCASGSAARNAYFYSYFCPGCFPCA